MEFQRVTLDDLSHWRRQLLQVLDQLFGRAPSRTGAGARLADLIKSNRVPRYIGALMKTVLEVRNAAEYEALELTIAEGEAVRNAWAAILDWVAPQQPTVAA